MSTISVHSTQQSSSPAFYFSQLKHNSSFKEKLEAVLEKEVTSNIFSTIWRCDALFSKTKGILGVVVYENQLTPESRGDFYMREFKILNETGATNFYATMLLNRVLQKARDMRARGILFKSPKNDKMIQFLRQKNFRIMIGQDKDTYLYSENLKKCSYHDECSEIGESKKRSTQEDLGSSVTSSKEARIGAQSAVSASQRTIAKNPKIHSLPMKGTIFLEYIMKGLKKFEGRVCAKIYENMSVGDELRLYDYRARWGIVCDITSITKYPTFESMLNDKGVLSMLPQLESRSKHISNQQLLQEAIKIYQGFPGSERVKQLGVLAIGVNFIKKYT